MREVYQWDMYKLLAGLTICIERETLQVLKSAVPWEMSTEFISLPRAWRRGRKLVLLSNCQIRGLLIWNLHMNIFPTCLRQCLIASQSSSRLYRTHSRVLNSYLKLVIVIILNTHWTTVFSRAWKSHAIQAGLLLFKCI